MKQVRPFEHKKNIITCLVCFSLVFLAYYLFSGANLSGDSAGADAVRNAIQQAGDHNQAAIDRSVTLEGQRGRIEAGITSSLDRAAEHEARIDFIAGGLGELQISAQDDKQLLAGIREINESQDKSP